MKFEISLKAVLGVLVTVGLSVVGWFVLGHIELGSRVTVLESDAQEDARQDEELREIRKTMQDMVVLFFHEHQAMPVHGDPPALVGSVEAPVLVEEPFSFEGAGNADEAFNAVQMDLETALRFNGLEPAVKAVGSKRD